ncbi:CLUMA_CG007869, isoform A [Clunio marinus]|uniref:CLUMA_CG007869, isoform A n=1 Tax=Clunio marinus TaxID=568069 RepID=A0A1J1I2B6_9DIPT|nr:CLUMA_CG007869, isoform A [Clunio marinus]
MISYCLNLYSAKIKQDACELKQHSKMLNSLKQCRFAKDGFIHVVLSNQKQIELNCDGNCVLWSTPEVARHNKLYLLRASLKQEI